MAGVCESKLICCACYCFSVMGDIIHHRLPIRRNMVTRGMGLGSFSLGKPRAKLSKSIPLVTIFRLIGSPWWILYFLVYKISRTQFVDSLTRNRSINISHSRDDPPTESITNHFKAERGNSNIFRFRNHPSYKGSTLI